MLTSTEKAKRVRLVVAACFLAVVLFVLVGWFLLVFGSPDPVATAYRDWIQFQRTAVRIASGRLTEIYPAQLVGGDSPESRDGFFFLYPPFVAWITLPLAPLSRLGAYVACAGAVAVGTLLGILVILRSLGTSTARRITTALGSVASAPWSGAVMLGHLSALLLLAPAAALLAWSRRRPAMTGGFLALLLAKPNWGLPLLGLLMVGRRWRMVVGFLAGGALLVLVSLPLGPGLWGEWWRTMVAYRVLIAGATAPWKQATLLATIESLVGRRATDPLVVGAWVLTCLPLVLATAFAWLRHAGDEGRFPRLLGVALLTILVVNPYAYFYDAVLAIPIGIVLWTSPGSYASPALRRWAMAATGVTWIWMYVQYFWLTTASPSLAGLGLAAWLVAELGDLVGQRKKQWAPPDGGAHVAFRRGPAGSSPGAERTRRP
ncbi:MAG: DUF2029 domain-containing protein [Gemmatimonadetes bacterium]|nr:DUF2029 domain-containing protein [Gemmatimonadota bacterium]